MAKCDYCGRYNENRLQCYHCDAPLDIGKAYPKKLPYDPFKVPTTDEIETQPIANKQKIVYDPWNYPKVSNIKRDKIHK